MALTHCRFYEAKYPEVDELVMVNVKQIAEMGAYVKLLEYDDIDGMILLSELSRRRIRSVQKLIRVGRNEVAVVLRVDKDKGYIDLSKRRVSPEDILRCEERYNKSRSVHSILRHVAEKTGTPLEQLYQEIGWPLQKKFGHALDAFRLSITDPETVWGDGGAVAAPPQELTEYIASRLTPQPIKVRADVEVTCFGYDGIDAIKTALKAAEQAAEDSVKVRLVAPPLYVMTCQTGQKSQGIQLLEGAIERTRKAIRGNGGECIVKLAPTAVDSGDDARLQALMEQRERENAEVSGDEDSDDASDDGHAAAIGSQL